MLPLFSYESPAGQLLHAITTPSFFYCPRSCPLAIVTLRWCSIWAHFSNTFDSKYLFIHALCFVSYEWAKTLSMPMHTHHAELSFWRILWTVCGQNAFFSSRSLRSPWGAESDFSAPICFVKSDFASISKDFSWIYIPTHPKHTHVYRA